MVGNKGPSLYMRNSAVDIPFLLNALLISILKLSFIFEEKHDNALHSPLTLSGVLQSTHKATSCSKGLVCIIRHLCTCF